MMVIMMFISVLYEYDDDDDDENNILPVEFIHTSCAMVVAIIITHLFSIYLLYMMRMMMNWLTYHHLHHHHYYYHHFYRQRKQNKKSHFHQLCKNSHFVVFYSIGYPAIFFKLNCCHCYGCLKNDTRKNEPPPLRDEILSVDVFHNHCCFFIRKNDLQIFFNKKKRVELFLAEIKCFFFHYKIGFSLFKSSSSSSS